MKTVDEYRQLIEREVRLVTSIKYKPASLIDPMFYALKGGGKRLRPILVLAVADALGADWTRFTRVALAVEMFHNFTLLHDDIMDHSDTRHGRPSVPAKYGDAAAILSGDAMLTHSILILMENSHTDPELYTRLLHTFNVTAIKVYSGQALDMDMECRSDVTEDEYFSMIGKKTAVLLSGSCHLGALIAQAPDTLADPFIDYGDNLGIAFQLQDDYLDTFGDRSFGKPIGGDILNDKNTWLRIMALREAPDKMEAARALSPEEKIAAVTEIYRSLNLDKRCEALVDTYTSRAVSAIAHIDISDDARRFFEQFALSLVHRSK